MLGLMDMARLSHRLGGSDYVKGGGGNTSFKDPSTLWIKPSGIALWQVTPQNVVALDRRRLAALYDVAPPTEVAAREAVVRDAMAAAVIDAERGRPSVESPLPATHRRRNVLRCTGRPEGQGEIHR